MEGKERRKSGGKEGKNGERWREEGGSFWPKGGKTEEGNGGLK